MSEHDDDNHGHSVAAWTAVVIMMVAAVIGGIAIIVGSWPLFWIGGIGLIVVGAIVGKVMQLMGYGVTPVGSAEPREAPPQTAS